MTADASVLLRLAETIAARRGADPETSHTARMLAKGPEKCAEKFGEEAVEAIIEAVRGDRPRLVSEAADVLYHLLVMLAAREVPLSAVLDELARREGRSGVAERAARPAIRRAGPEDLPACLEVRRRVFVEEQGVDPALEIDGLDPDCRHWIAEAKGRAVATARVRIAGGRAKIQRVAVLAEARGGGLGAALMRAILGELAADPGLAEAWLESQIQAIPFYERLGFVAEGEAFLDAGIPHRLMRRPLR